MNPKEHELDRRLRKAGIDPDVFAELIWARIKAKIIPLIKDMAKQHGTKREAILAQVMSGLAARWSFGDRDCTSPQHLAEQAERLTDAVMREEDKRRGTT